MLMSDGAQRKLWLLIIGFGVWLLAFCVLYAAHSLGCQFGLHRIAFGPISAHRLVLVSLFLITLLGLGVLVLRMRQAEHERQDTGGRTAGFLLQVGSLATLAALGASAFSLAPVIGLSLCV
jgi:hypothetical protein